LRHEAIHPPILIALPVQQHEIRKPRRIKHLTNPSHDRVVVVIPAGMDQGRRLVVNQELIEVRSASGDQIEIR